jgi:hypothetical protein
MMENMKKKTTILLAVFTVCTFVCLSTLFIEHAFPGSEQDVKDNGGFAQAKTLEGRWVRLDGGYTLVMEDIKPDGSLKASYFNPRKINVQEANWKLEGGRLHLFVELRDVNYPGSKYSLVYMDEKDVLSGTYFQAVQRQTFDIKFVRS